MKHTIYWFSGTGNSLYAAKALAEAMGNTVLVPIAQGAPTEAAGGEGCKLGFVFPSYYGDLPRLVRAFAERLNILPGTDLFAVVTMGAFGQGSVKAMQQLLAAKGFPLRYGVGVRMNANYILAYDPALFGAKSERRVRTKLDKADAKLRQIAADIQSGKTQLKTSPITAQTLYKNVAALDAEFTVNDTCTHCGLCARLCPVDNIKLADGKPVWQHHCEHCVACISWCPAAAIDKGTDTAKRTRYRNPHIKVGELEHPQGAQNNAI